MLLRSTIAEDFLIPRKNPYCDMMTRGEGGTDEETFLAFFWMENFRSWSGMIVHHYFKFKPLEVRIDIRGDAL
jgi:hypothetical protein